MFRNRNPGSPVGLDPALPFVELMDFEFELVLVITPDCPKIHLEGRYVMKAIVFLPDLKWVGVVPRRRIFLFNVLGAEKHGTFPENTELAAIGQGVVTCTLAPTGERPSRARRGSPR